LFYYAKLPIYIYLDDKLIAVSPPPYVVGVDNHLESCFAQSRSAEFDGCCLAHIPRI